MVGSVGEVKKGLVLEGRDDVRVGDEGWDAGWVGRWGLRSGGG